MSPPLPTAPLPAAAASAARAGISRTRSERLRPGLMRRGRPGVRRVGASKPTSRRSASVHPCFSAVAHAAASARSAASAAAAASTFAWRASASSRTETIFSSRRASSSRRAACSADCTSVGVDMRRSYRRVRESVSERQRAPCQQVTRPLARSTRRRAADHRAANDTATTAQPSLRDVVLSGPAVSRSDGLSCRSAGASDAVATCVAESAS